MSSCINKCVGQLGPDPLRGLTALSRCIQGRDSRVDEGKKWNDKGMVRGEGTEGEGRQRFATPTDKLKVHLWLFISGSAYLSHHSSCLAV